jgi:hypothetical protein
MRSGALFSCLATMIACALFAAPAQAQRDRVFVASYGSDSNPCTFGSPCKTFQNAVNVVAAGGEVTAIDSAGFGPVTIHKAVTITSPNGVEAGIAAGAGDAAVLVQAGMNDTVVLSGLTLEGAGSAADGIYLTSGGELEVVNCAVRNYTEVGIRVSQNTAATTLLISNTVVSDMTGVSADGILLQTSGNGSVTAAINQVVLTNNTNGVQSLVNGGPIEAAISNSHIDNNLQIGIDTEGSSTASSNIILKNVSLNQTPDGIFLNQYSNVWLSHVTQGNASGFPNDGGVFFNTSGTGNTAYSDGTNHIMGGYVHGSATAWSPQ